MLVNDTENPDEIQESFYLQDKATNELQLFNLYSYSKLLDKKVFKTNSPGVHVSCMSTRDAIMRIDPGAFTNTKKHEKEMIYVVRKGEGCLFSINGLITRHEPSDIIKIPAGKYFLLYIIF